MHVILCMSQHCMLGADTLILEFPWSTDGEKLCPGASAAHDLNDYLNVSMKLWVLGWWEFWTLSWYHDGMGPLGTLKVYESVLHLGSMRTPACGSMGCSRQSPDLPSPSLKHVPPESLELVNMMGHHFYNCIMSYGTADLKTRRLPSGLIWSHEPL